MARAPLVERERQLAALLRVVRSAAEGRGGALVVAGEAGAGRTALLDAAVDALDGGPVQLRGVRGTPLEASFELGLMRTLLHPWPDDVGAGPQSGEDGRAWLEAVFAQATERADCRPLAWFVDDAHDADRASLQALAYIANRVTALPIAIVATVRDGAAASDPTALEALRQSSSTISLAPLSRRGVQAMCAARGVEVHPAEAEAVARLTGGIPAIVERLRAGGVLDEALRLVLLSQSPEARAVAEAVAVLGDDAPARRVAACAPVPGDRIRQAAQELATAGVLAAGPAFAVAHPALRTALLSTMGAHRVVAARERAAAVLGADGAAAAEIAEHLVALPPDADDHVVQRLLEGADEAMAEGDPASAVRYLERAAHEPPNPVTSLRVETLRGLAEARLGRYGDAAARLASVAAHPGTSPDVLIELGQVSTHMAGASEAPALQALLDAAEDPRQADDQRLLLQATAALAGWYVTAPRRPPDLPEPDGLSAAADGEAAALAAHGLYRSDTCLVDAVPLAIRALRSGRLTARPADHLNAFNAISVLVWAGRMDDVDLAVAEMQAVAEATGSVESSCLAALVRALRFAVAGDVTAAAAEHDAIAALTAGRGDEVAVMRRMARSVHLDVTLASEGPAAASALLAVTDDVAVPPFYAAWELAPRALVALAAGRSRQAREDAERHAAFADGHGGLALPAGWHAALPLARRADGDAAGARDAAESWVARERHHAMSDRLGCALRTLGRLDADHELDLLLEAASCHENGTMRLERAATLVALGAAMGRAGHHEEGAAHVREAADIATACGATAVAGTAITTLRRLGHRPRREVFSGPDALTRAELEMASLAADGVGNREIAERLHVTRKTVEFHLSNAYRKLGIRSRAALAEALAAGKD